MHRGTPEEQAAGAARQAGGVVHRVFPSQHACKGCLMLSTLAANVSRLHSRPC